QDLRLAPDGREAPTEQAGDSAEARPASQSPRANSKLEIGNSKLQTGGRNAEVGDALRSLNFWLILAGCTLTIGAIGTVVQHFILFLKDQGYSAARASRISSGLLMASL